VNDIWISHERHPTYAWAFGDFLSTLRELLDAFNHALDACANAGGSCGIFRGDPLQNILKLRLSEPRVYGLHARRYFAKTASTSPSLATSPRSRNHCPEFCVHAAMIACHVRAA
jgi:hypothetical protein